MIRSRSTAGLLLAASFAAPSLADIPVPADVRAMGIHARVERAVVTGSLERLTELRETYAAALESRGGELHPNERYVLAYVSWRIGQLLGDDDGRRKKRLLKEAERQLDLLLDERPGDAEAHALRGSVIGDRITGAVGGLFLGPKASRALDRAFELAPENPRVALLRGIGFYFTPRAFGGGLENARRELERAHSLFEADAATDAGETWPNWGRVDALAWLGQALADSGETDRARGLYDRALGLEPDHAWVRDELLPALGDGRR